MSYPVAGRAAAGGDHHQEDEDAIEKEWLRKMQGWLMMVAVQIAAVAFQAAVNPPGGLWQESKDNKQHPTTTTTSTPRPAFAIPPDTSLPTPNPPDLDEPQTVGRPIMRDIDPTFYTMFRLMNVGAFMYSASVILLLLRPSAFRHRRITHFVRMLLVGALVALFMAFFFCCRPGAGRIDDKEYRWMLVFLFSWHALWCGVSFCCEHTPELHWKLLLRVAFRLGLVVAPVVLSYVAISYTVYFIAGVVWWLAVYSWSW